MKKWIFPLLIILAMVLAACPAPAPTSAPAGEQAAPAAEEAAPAAEEAAPAAAEEAPAAGEGGVLVYNSYSSDPLPRAADEELVQMFQEKTGIKVEHSIVAHEDFKQAIRTYLTSDSPPDVLTWFAGNRARFFIDKGLIMDISDVWEREGWNESYPKGFRALSTVDGKQYFVPTSYYWWAIYYRPSIYQEVGLEPPTNWDELLNACDVLNEAGYIPFTIGTKFRWTAAAWFDYLNMRINGPEFHINLMLGKESYDDPRVKDVFAHWKQLLDHKCFVDNAAAYSWQEALDFMVQGDAASYLMGAFITDSFPDEMEEDLDFYQFPIINPDVPIGEDAPTDGYFAAANAPHPEEAKAFLAYVGGAESQTYFAKKVKRLATNSQVDPSIYTEPIQKGIKLIQSADYVAQFYDRDTTPEMADKGMNAMMAFWDNPDNIDSILADLEKERQRIFAESE
jgi:multiple sugar transport system substrate-binding protein/raffinose/stachyose/melibiose transport system substrate-binding protein